MRKLISSISSIKQHERDRARFRRHAERPLYGHVEGQLLVPASRGREWAALPQLPVAVLKIVEAQRLVCLRTQALVIRDRDRLEVALAAEGIALFVPRLSCHGRSHPLLRADASGQVRATGRSAELHE